MDGLRRTPEAWCEQLETVICDPDGWRGHMKKDWNEPITKIEFLARFTISTAKQSKTVVNETEIFKNEIDYWLVGYEAGYSRMSVTDEMCDKIAEEFAWYDDMSFNWMGHDTGLGTKEGVRQVIRTILNG